MASLYTPEPQRQGLDWLAGLVRSGQALAQRERQIQLQKKQQQIQVEHFWSEQARLKGQQDFQNRKFLYDVRKDQHQELRQSLLDDRAWKNTQTDNTRMDNQQAWARDPTNPYVANVQANTRTTNARREYEYGDGATGGGGTLFPESLPTDEGGTTDALLGSPEGREDVTPPDGAAPTASNGVKPPYTITPVEGGKIFTTNQYNPSGTLKSRSNRYVPNPAGVSEEDVLDKKNNTLNDDLRTLANSKRNTPAYPAGEEITPQQKETYEARKTEVVAHNTEIDRQMANVERSIYKTNAPAAAKRMRTIKLGEVHPTPAFDEKVYASFQRAFVSGDPSQLIKLRPQLEKLAKAQDATANYVLDWVDQVLGAPLVSLAETPVSAPAVKQKAPSSLFTP